MLLSKSRLFLNKVSTKDRLEQLVTEIVSYFNKTFQFNVNQKVMNKLLFDCEIGGKNIQKMIYINKDITWETKYIALSNTERFKLVYYSVHTVLKPLNINNISNMELFTLICYKSVYNNRLKSIMGNILMSKFHKDIYIQDIYDKYINI